MHISRAQCLRNNTTVNSRFEFRSRYVYMQISVHVCRLPAEALRYLEPPLKESHQISGFKTASEQTNRPTP